jgi:hypothetical protein
MIFPFPTNEANKYGYCQYYAPKSSKIAIELIVTLAVALAVE